MTILQNNKALKRLVWIASVAIPVVVALLFSLPAPGELDAETASKVYLLPMLNAFFNGTAFFCLIGSYVAVRSGKLALQSTDSGP